jgi:hypothetical protein
MRHDERIVALRHEMLGIVQQIRVVPAQSAVGRRTKQERLLPRRRRIMPTKKANRETGKISFILIVLLAGFLLSQVIAPSVHATPTIGWSTYLGGANGDWGDGIAVDKLGNVFVTGSTSSSGWVSSGIHTNYNGGAAEAFVVKLSSSGAHVWSTYLGGQGLDVGWGIATDATGDVFVVGETESAGWISLGYDATLGGYRDGFVVKLAGAGTYLWSTYLGGDDLDYGYSVATDSDGNAYVAGTTYSSGWVSGGYDTTFNGGLKDAFAVKLSTEGQMVWSTYLGGSDDDEGQAIAVNSAGKVFVTGSTKSSGWVSGGPDITQNGNQDIFVVALFGAGSHLWSTYLGGSNDDGGYGITTDKSGNVLVTGITFSSGWVSGGYDTTYNGNSDGFIAKMSEGGAQIWSTYLGGSGLDEGWAVATNGFEGVFVAGTTESSGWIAGGFDGSYNGYYDGFVAAYTDAGTRVWGSYLGGNKWDEAHGVATLGAWKIYVTGQTSSSDWMTGGFDTTYNGGTEDAFAAKILLAPVAPAEIDATPRSLNFGSWAWDGGTTGPLTVTIKNVGADEPLEFIANGVVIVGQNAADFHVDPAPDLTPLAPDESRVISVYFDPSESFPRAAVLRFMTNDPNSGALDVPLTGKGTGRMPAAARKHWALFE